MWGSRLLRTIPRTVWLAVGLTLVGLVARLYNLEARSFWLDEVSQAHVTRFSTLDEVLSYTHTVGNVMPLMNALVWAMRDIATNEWVLRFPSALAGTLNVFALFWLGKTLVNARVGLVAAFLMALLPEQVWYGQDARPYTFLLLFTTLQFLFIYMAAWQSRHWLWVPFVVCTVLNLYTHYLAIIATAAAFAFIGVVLLADLVRASSVVRRPSSLPYKGAAAKWGWALLAAGVIFLAYSPWLPHLRVFLERTDLGFNLFGSDHELTLPELLSWLGELDFSGALLFFFCAGLLTMLAALVAFRGYAAQAALLAIWIGLPTLVFVVRLGGGIVTVLPRYFSYLLPAAILIGAWGIEGVVGVAARVVNRFVPVSRRVDAEGPGGGEGFVPNSKLRTQNSELPEGSGGRIHALIYILALLVVGAQVIPALAHSYGVTKEDTRGMAAYLIKQGSPSPIVITMGKYGNNIGWGLRYYLWRGGSDVSFFSGSKVDDSVLKGLEGMQGSVWGAAFDGERVAQEALGSDRFEAVRFPQLVLFRLRASAASTSEGARELLAVCSEWEPSLLSGLDLFNAWYGKVPPGPNLLPSPLQIESGMSGNSDLDARRWRVTSGVVAGGTEENLVFTPENGVAEATWNSMAGSVHPGERYVFSFYYRNAGLTGEERIYVTSLDAERRTFDYYPNLVGYYAPPTAEWTRGMFAFTTSDRTAYLSVRLSVKGSGSAEMREVALWRVR